MQMQMQSAYNRRSGETNSACVQHEDVACFKKHVRTGNDDDLGHDTDELSRWCSHMTGLDRFAQ